MQTRKNRLVGAVGSWIQRFLEVRLPVGTASGLRKK
jgi:hypothetical protein